MNGLPTVATLLTQDGFDLFSACQSSEDWAFALASMLSNHGGYPADFTGRILDGGLAMAVAHRWAAIKNPTGAPVTADELAAVDACTTSGHELLSCLCAMACARNGAAPVNMASEGVIGRMVAAVTAHARPTA